jgi:uncharacterized protein (DUF58 family)
LNKPFKISAFKAFQLNTRFFIGIGIVSMLYVLGFVASFFSIVALVALVALFTITIVETIVLFSGIVKLRAEREKTRMFSLGDENPIRITLWNEGGMMVDLDLYDEVPFQFQKRDFKIEQVLVPGEEKKIEYHLRPVIRGEYHFGHINAIASVWLKLASRRILLGAPSMVPVMPSVIQMKKYELMAFARISTFEGIKKIRRLGHSYEFEQIKNYSLGDDIRSINWKATGRRNTLMVNQYEDERSQQVYMIIDKSRSMHMPFNGLSLLDYSINTSLVLANIALKKYDRVGLISFSNLIGSTLPAESHELQLKKIMNALYHEKPQPLEANFDLLYRSVKNVIKSRSLVMLYLNFESIYAMERALPILQKINQLHLLVVMIFENTELNHYTKKEAKFVSDIYAQTIAEKLSHEKKQIVSKLKKHGIQTILSKPEDLSINTVNKYLELKSKGLI